MIRIYAIVRDKASDNLKMIQELVEVPLNIDDVQLSRNFNYSTNLSDTYCSYLPAIPVKQVAGTRTYRAEAFVLETATKRIRNEYDVVAISHRYGGYTHFDWNFGDDITFHIYTNFGYGSVSEFNSTFKYKGIILAPYSYYVKYKNSDYASVVRCTYSYELRYDQWRDVMQDCLDFYNAVVQGYENYIFDWLNSQLSQMLSGLEDFIDRNSCKLGSSFRNNRVSSYTEVYDDDFWIIKSKKICYSLKFVDNIKALPGHTCSDDYIERLVGICRKFKPKLEAKIEFTNSLIKEVEKEVDSLCSNKDYQLYLLLKKKYYYSRRWNVNKYRRYWFLLHLLKRLKPDYRLEEIRPRCRSLEERIEKVDKAKEKLCSLHKLYSTLNDSLLQMNDDMNNLKKIVV